MRLGKELTLFVSSRKWINRPSVVRLWELHIVLAGAVFTLLMSKDTKGSPGGSEDKESVCNKGDLSLIPGSGRSPGEGNGNPL